MTERDARWVEMAVAGDDAAFDELVARHRSRVCQAATRILHCREMANDVAQEAFVRAYMTLPKLRDPAKFGAWVVGIAENLCRMELRRRREPTVSQEPVDAAAPAFPATVNLDILPRATRDAAELYFLQGMKMREVSRQLGIPLTAVKSRIRDARRGLQGKVEPMKTKSDSFDRELQRRLELARWYREFGKLASSGVPVLQILDMLGNGPYSDSVKGASAKLRKTVEGGTSLSAALKRLPALRTPETVPAVRAGEVGGILDRIAVVLADWIDVGSAQREIELSFWLRTLGEMIDAGVPLDAALSWGLEHPANAGLQALLTDIAAAAAAGRPISPIVGDAVDVLPATVRLSIIAGEHAGCLGFGLRWAGDELASGVCDRLTGSMPRNPSNGDREAFAAEIARILPEEPLETRRAAAAALGRLGSSGAGQSLSRCLADSDPVVRATAVQGLANLRAGDLAEQVSAMLNDPEAEVRLAAVLALGALDARNFAPKLVQAIRDTDLPTAKAAMDAVEAMGEVELLTSFAIETLEGEPSIAMFFAVDILRSHPVPEAVPVLVASLGRAPHIAITAALILAGSGRDEGRLILREAVGSPFGITVSQAAEALESLRDRESAPLIRDAVAAGRLSEEWLRRADRLAVGG